MGPDLSVVFDHPQFGVGEPRTMMTEPWPLTPSERADAVEHIKSASAAQTCGLCFTVLTAVASRRSALPAPDLLRHSCECLCSTCEAQGAGYFAQRAALAGDSQAAERLSPAVFTTLAAERGRRRHGRKAAAQSARRGERSAYGSL